MFILIHFFAPKLISISEAKLEDHGSVFRSSMQSPQALHGALSLQRLIFVPPSRKYGLFYHKQFNLLMASSVLISVDYLD